VLARWRNAHGGDESALAQAALARLIAPSESALMLKLAEYPGLLARAAAELAPHDVAFYLRELAALVHSYYAAEKFLVEDDPELMRARMALLAATRQVLASALAILGASAPQAMSREGEAGPRAEPEEVRA
jgi:arginyl-tRNA synthetase